MKSRRLFFIGAFFILFVVFPSVVTLTIDWWWFSEVGYSNIFIKSLATKILLFFSVFVFVASFLFTNLYLAIRSKSPWVASLPEMLIGRSINLDNRVIKKLAITASLVIALFFGFSAVANWQEILRFYSATSFGVVDPIFGKDVAFYIFSLPIFQFTLGIVKMLIVLTLIICAFIYVLRGSLRFPALSAQRGLQSLRNIEIDPSTRLHLGILLTIFLATIAIGIYLSLFSLLTSQSGLIFGATYTDATIRIPLLWISFGVVLFAVASLFIWIWRGSLALFAGSIFLYILVGIASVIIPSLVQKLSVTPNEIVKETPFIKNNIDATRQAFALNEIEEREISVDKPITSADITANNLTIKNVRLWDRNPLLSTFSQIQEIRTYYEFVEVDDDRYIIDGEIRQVMLSLRELASASLPNRNWINERLTFTHGYGVAAGPVNQVTPEGLPVLFVKDLPPKSDVKELEISRPEIYFSELSNDYIITNTKSREFNYPKGEENVYSDYEGSGGVEINSFLKRIFYAFKFKSLALLLSNDITRESRIIYLRNISDRVAKIAPFLTFDKDPYSVIADGKLYWIADAYTTSDRYPYSQPLKLNGKNINYIRNSVKAVVDAYNGKITFYQADAKDPILQTYAKIFPGTFKPISEMPKSLISHIRYPQDIFTLQTNMYSIYHMDDPQAFYNKEDQWEVPIITVDGDGVSKDRSPQMQPRHIIMRLPEEKKEEYILMLPFTPRAKDNLSAWIVARNDGENYGNLIVYRFPKDKLIFGPKQIIGRINQDPEISQQLSLWNQGGSQVIQGPLLVIPIEESLLYVRSLFLKAENGKIPELKRVIVAYENKIAMKETLEEGLAVIFGNSPTMKLKDNKIAKQKITITENTTERIKKALSAYEESLRAQRDGDWTRYGDAIKRLGEILKQ
ncbi:MAG: UPF0182 family protein [Patescibacteria group bacterium]